MISTAFAKLSQDEVKTDFESIVGDIARALFVLFDFASVDAATAEITGEFMEVR